MEKQLSMLEIFSTKNKWADAYSGLKTVVEFNIGQY